MRGLKQRKAPGAALRAGSAQGESSRYVHSPSVLNSSRKRSTCVCLIKMAHYLCHKAEGRRLESSQVCIGCSLCLGASLRVVVGHVDGS